MTTAASLRFRRITTLLVGLGFALGLTVPASAVVYKVGGDMAVCTHNDLQTAIDQIPGNPGDKILVASDRFYFGQELQIDSKTLVIEGGYETCDGPRTAEPTEILGSLADSVVAVAANAGTADVTLRGLYLRNGQAERGGGAYVGAGADVVFDEVRFSTNTATILGGAIYATTGSTVELLDTTVDGNSAGSGGGIMCSGCDLTLLQGNSILGNTATIRGGGIYVYQQGQLTLGPGNDVSFNTARLGAGISAFDGHVALLGGAGQPIQLRENTASTGSANTHKGGGVLLEGASTLEGTHVEFVANEVKLNTGACGGGLAVVEQSQAQLWSEGPDTLLFEGNQINDGSAICVLDEAQLSLFGAALRENLPMGAGFSSVVQVRGDDAFLNTEGLVMTRNQADTLLDATSGALVVLAHASTHANAGSAGGSITSVVRAEHTGTDVQVVMSILDESTSPSFEPFQINPSSAFYAECLMIAGTPQGLPTMDHLLTGTFANVWIQPGQDDFHLHPASPAIDFCDSGYYTTQAPDYDHGARGVDDPATADNYAGAIVDLGADEFGSGQADEIFSAGFESGDLSEWSAVVN